LTARIQLFEGKFLLRIFYGLLGDESSNIGTDQALFLRWWMRWCEVVEFEVVKFEVVEFEVVEFEVVEFEVVEFEEEE
jgi:hypothetical protein